MSNDAIHHDASGNHAAGNQPAGHADARAEPRRQPAAGPARPKVELGWGDLAAIVGLALFVLLLFARLLFTNRVLGSGDILHYFYPYRDYAAAVLRTGELPLWNPYIFLGVPFLANPQAAVLYPFHWPLLWLSITQQLYWSAALHTWILGVGGYLLLRGWARSRWAGLVTGLVLAGSGFYGGLIGHINQMNGAAWLPWALWVLTWVDDRESAAPYGGEPGRHDPDLSDPTGPAQPPGQRWARTLSAAGAFGLLVVFMFMAGHTQTLYINLFGLGVWSVAPLASLVRPGRQGTSTGPAHRRRVRSQVLRRLTVYAAGCGVAALVVMPQMLPTLELSALGLRQGGLDYAAASSFSLRPLQIAWSLLPSYGLVDLSIVFASPGYSEFVAYVGLVGLFLALWGAWRARSAGGMAGLLLAGLGLFLALGRWNPAYYLFYALVPGFDLFRVPARWMMLYTLGMAILAGVGLDAWVWARRRTAICLGLVALVALELLLAARALPHTQTTAPQAVYDTRTAPAHLLTDPVRETVHPAAAGRFLSMSPTTFDPGDMGDYARILRESSPPQLDGKAFHQLVLALKSHEILAPNLALLWRVPSLDGFDGGVLPLARYLDLLTLFIHQDQLIADGRLREQVETVPPARLLSPLNVQYIITDKVRDLWFQDIYYDRQIGAVLGSPGAQAAPLHDASNVVEPNAGATSPEASTTIVNAPQPFPATHVHLIAAVEAPPEDLPREARPVLRVQVEGDYGRSGAPDALAVQAAYTVTAGSAPGADLADSALDSPVAAANGAQVAYQDVEGGSQEYLVTLSLPAPLAPQQIRLTGLEGDLPVRVQAVTLVDARTEMFAPLLPSDRGRFRRVHSGDVKIYENLDVLPRAYMVPHVQRAVDAEAAVALMRDGAFDPRQTAVVEGDSAMLAELAAGAPADERAGERTGERAVEIVDYAPEAVTVRTASEEPGLLVLADAYYPGWRVTVDGDDAPLYRTNILLRGAPVPAGEHTVRFTYAPVDWRLGLALGGLGIFLLLGLWLSPWVFRLRARSAPGV